MTTTHLASILLTPLVFATVAHADAPAGSRQGDRLALETGPPSVTAKAGVFVHDRTGYVKARDSQNGFVCVVDHQPPQRHRAAVHGRRGGQDVPAEVPVGRGAAREGHGGARDPQGVQAAFHDGTLKAPARPGVIYMMSPHNVVTVDEEHGVAVPFPGAPDVLRAEPDL